MKKNEEITTKKWRLSEKPTVDNLLKLVEGGVLTKEEAKEILLTEEKFNQTVIDDVKDEIQVLRKMVLELSNNSPSKIEIIKIVEKEIPVRPAYPLRYWGKPYEVWCSAQNTISLNGTTAQNIN